MGLPETNSPPESPGGQSRCARRRFPFRLHRRSSDCIFIHSIIYTPNSKIFAPASKIFHISHIMFLSFESKIWLFYLFRLYLQRLEGIARLTDILLTISVSSFILLRKSPNFSLPRIRQFRNRSCFRISIPPVGEAIYGRGSGLFIWK